MKISFSPEDPFPLLPSGQHTYAEEQAHSEKVDQWLGFKIEEIEASLAKAENVPGFQDQQLWIGLPPKRMLTPYTEIRTLLHGMNLMEGCHVMDLGAGYGRMGFVIARHYPGVRFTGHEYVKERVLESRRCLARWNVKNIEFRQTDLARPETVLESADIYFIYDYGTQAAVEKTLGDLQGIARVRPITVVGRGRLSRDTIERSHPWLSQVIQPEHLAHYSIYRTA